MRLRRTIPIAVLVLLVIGAGAAATYFLTDSLDWHSILIRLGFAEPEVRALTASGIIEAEEIDISPQLRGRVTRRYVDPGDQVTTGALLLQLDGTLLEAEVELARARVDIAEARLAQVEAGARAEQIRQAEADLARALAARDGTYGVWQDTLAIPDNPQQLNAEIAATRSELDAAQAHLAAAVATKDAAVISHERYFDARERWPDIRSELEERYQDYLDAIEEWEEAKRRLEEEYEDFWESDEWEELRRELEEWYERILEAKLPEVPTEMPAQLSFHMVPYQYWRAWVGANTAGAKLEQVRTRLRHLLTMRDDPQELRARADSARAEYEQARAAVQQAEAQLRALRSGATSEEIAVVEAQLEQDQAALNRLLVEQDKLTLTAPVGGLILKLSVHEGELATPGVTLLTLGNLDQVTLTIYVPVDQVGRVQIGQEAEIEVDGFPGQIFTGRVVAIADQAEFIPRSIQVREERVNMVFAVDIAIPNPDHRLKPGVPADATIIPQEP